VDEHGILIAAEEARAVVMIDREPGSSIVAGTPIGLAWPLRGHSLDADGLTRLQDRVGRALRTGNERTAAQDPGFGLRQLTDVATKALSPGINDPTTAIHALSHASALLCELSVRDLGPRLLRDNEQTIRVSLHRSTFSDLLELAVEQPRRYGAADPDVLARLFRLLNEVAWAAPQPDQLRAVAGQLDRLRATAAHQDFDPTERTRLTGLAQDVEQTLHRSRPAR
jgi:uncharacterized membrane protein